MKYLATVAVLVVLAVAPSAAFADGSQCQTYNPQTCQSLTSRSGALPFTGIDVGLLVVGGGALLSVGFVLRRLTRRLN